jgi:hypothetical protein
MAWILKCQPSQYHFSDEVFVIILKIKKKIN